MGKEKKVNPVDAARRKEKLKDLKRNRELRKQHRDVALHKMTPQDIQDEILKIQRMGHTASHRTRPHHHN
jgi:WW domain binding protein 11